MNRNSEIYIEKTGDILVITLSGALNASLGERLLEKLKTQLERARNVLIDLTDVDYLDSAGMGALVSIQMSTKRKGDRCILAGLQGAPLEVMKSSQLLRIFQVQDSRQGALDELAQSEA